MQEMSGRWKNLYIAITLLTAANSISPQADDYKERKVEVVIGKIVEGVPGSGSTIILLEKDAKSPRYLPITIGLCEAVSLREYLEDRSFPRPLTYNLIINMLSRQNIKILEAVITKLEGSTFYARLFLKRGDEIWWEDARPSDAINIALRANAPIYVMEELLNSYQKEENREK